MSPLWSDELRIALSPSGIAAVRLKRGLRPRIETRLSIACTIRGVTPWRAALDALPAVLSEYRGVASARIVLSNHYVRYLLLPWHAALADPQELVALARLRFKELHGSAADDWDVRLGMTRFGTSQLACAVDRALVTEIEQIFSQRSLRLPSVRPLLAVIYNRWRSVLTSVDCWFALCEAGRLCVCRIENGAWRSIANTRSEESGLARELQIGVEREALLLSPQPDTDSVFAFAPVATRDEMRNVPGFKISMLDACSGADRPYAMALA